MAFIERHHGILSVPDPGTSGRLLVQPINLALGRDANTDVGLVRAKGQDLDAALLAKGTQSFLVRGGVRPQPIPGQFAVVEITFEDDQVAVLELLEEGGCLGWQLVE